MTITVVCAHCGEHDKDPNLEINFRDGKIYYICPKCRKEGIISLKAENKPFPKMRFSR